MLELKVEEKINHFNNERWYEVMELESGEVLAERDEKEQALADIVKLIASKPDVYFTKIELIKGFAYRLSTTGASSSKYGMCEVCQQHADSVYLLTKLERVTLGDENRDRLVHRGSAFGHKECLARLTEKTAF